MQMLNDAIYIFSLINLWRDESGFEAELWNLSILLGL